MSRLLAIVVCSLISLAAFGSESVEDQPRPLIQVNVSFEMEAINAALQSTSQSVGEISESFRILAEEGNLDSEQQEHLAQIMINLDHVVGTTRDSVDSLPSLIENSRKTLLTRGAVLLDDIKFWTVTLLILLGVVLAVAIACFYYFVLKPLQGSILAVTRNISEMAKAMENTSRSLEVSTQTQRELLKLQEAQGPATNT